jgi:transmembrane sensor
LSKPLKSRTTLDDEAVQWYLVISDGESATEEQYDAFLEWIQDPMAEAAYARCEQAWEVVGQLGKDPDIANTLVPPGESAGITRLSEWGSRRVLLQAACVAVLGILVVLAGPMGLGYFGLESHVYRTATGERQSVLLSDGSEITLNTQSEVQVSYSRSGRKLVMTRGEILFEVAHDKERPFTVDVDGGEVVALGTRFTIRKEEKHERVLVALLEGKVQVNATADSRVLAPNQSLLFSQKDISEPRVIEDVDKVTQWQHGRLSFTDTSLAELVEEVNRYSVKKLIIQDESLKSIKIDAYFDIGDLESLLYGLRQTAGVKWRHRDGNVFIFRDRALQE